MANRSFLTTIRSVWGGDFNQLLTEHNKLVDEVEELKAHYAAHCHTTGTKPIAVGTGTLSPAMSAADAQKIA